MASPVSQKILIATDAVVFGYHENKLYVLLIEQKQGIYKNKWALPGGFVKNKETLLQCVKRELKEETGIIVHYLEQFYTFGDDVHRDARAQVISVSYLSFVRQNKFDPQAGSDAKNAAWHEINHLPKLAFDHSKIVQMALKKLQENLYHQPIGFELLGKEFLFSDLENLYCTVFNRMIERRNFRKKIMALNILEESGNYIVYQHGRPAKLYRFNKDKYNELLHAGFRFEISFA